MVIQGYPLVVLPPNRMGSLGRLIWELHPPKAK